MSRRSLLVTVSESAIVFITFSAVSASFLCAFAISSGDVLFETPRLGKVAARFQVQGDAAKGYIVSDSERTVQALKSQENNLKEQLSSEDQSWNMDFVHSESLDLNRFTETGAGNSNDLDTEPAIVFITFSAVSASFLCAFAISSGVLTASPNFSRISSFTCSKSISVCPG